MPTIKVNTDKVADTANQIRTYNSQLNNDFSKVVNSLSKLNSSWESSTSSYAMGKFNEIKCQYPQARYDIVNSFTDFLLNHVQQGYEQTEVKNTSLSALFK